MVEIQSNYPNFQLNLISDWFLSVKAPDKAFFIRKVLIFFLFLHENIFFGVTSYECPQYYVFMEK